MSLPSIQLLKMQYLSFTGFSLAHIFQEIPIHFQHRDWRKRVETSTQSDPGGHYPPGAYPETTGVPQNHSMQRRRRVQRAAPNSQRNRRACRIVPSTEPKEVYHLHAFVLVFPSGFNTPKKLGLPLAGK